MASYFIKIDQRMSGDEKYRSLSKPQPNAQTLWIHLLTGPHKRSIPGIFRAGMGSLADDLEWESTDTKRAFAEIEELGMAIADHRARVIFIPNVVRYDPPSRPNVVKGWAKQLATLPETLLKGLWVARVWRFLCDEFVPKKGNGDSFREEFRNCFKVNYPQAFANHSEKDAVTLSKGLPEPFGKGSPTPFETSPAPAPFPNPQLEERGMQTLNREGRRDSPRKSSAIQTQPETQTAAGFIPPEPDPAPPRQHPEAMIRDMALPRDVPWDLVLEHAGGPPPWAAHTVTELRAWLQPQPRFTEAQLDQRRASRRQRDGPPGQPVHVGEVAQRIRAETGDAES